MMKVENDADVQSENSSIDIKSHEEYVSSSILIEEIKSEVSLVLGVFIRLAPFLTHFLSASHSQYDIHF
jgi:hypothetical protein